MSLMGMREATSKYWPAIAIVAAVLMGVTAFAGLGANLFSRGGGSAPAAQSNPTEKTVATVGDLKVTRGMLDQAVQRQIQQQAMFGQQAQPKPEEMDFLRLQALNSFKQQQALLAAAKAAGVNITDADVAQEREKVWQSQRPQIAQALSLPPTATDSQIDSAIAQQQPGASIAAIKASFPDYALRAQAAQEGLLKQLRSQVQVTPEQVKRSYDEIQVRHILIKTGDGGLPDDQAKAKAEKILAAVMADPAKMPQLANENSDDPGNTDPKTHQKKGGFYDWAPASQYVTEFSDAALQAGVGKVYPHVVKTQFGYHIIKLEGERPGKDLPKDFDKNTQTYIDQYRDRIAQQNLSAAVQKAVPDVKVAITDPALNAAQLQMDAFQKTSDTKARDAKLNQALDELSKVAKTDDPLGIVPLQKAQILALLGRNKDAIAAYNDALTYRNAPETRLALASLYVKQKDNANAKLQIAEAQKLPIPDPQMEAQISGILKQAGDADGAKKAMNKAIELFKRQQEIQKQEAAASLPVQTAPVKQPAAPAAPAKPKAGG